MGKQVQFVNSAVILTEGKSLESAIALLSQRVAGLLKYTYYSHVNELTGPAATESYDMIVVGTLRDLTSSIHLCQNRDDMLFIHLADHDEYKNTDYQARFPNLNVLPIRQANLTGEPDITLQFNQFEEAVTRRFAQKQTSTTPTYTTVPNATAIQQQELIEFLATAPSADKISAFKFSDTVQRRFMALIESTKTDALSPDEQTELETLMRYNQLVERIQKRIAEKATPPTPVVPTPDAVKPDATPE